LGESESKLKSHSRDRLEQLLRYCARPAISRRDHPGPRKDFILYTGVLAPNSKLRARVTAFGRQPNLQPRGSDAGGPKKAAFLVQTYLTRNTNELSQAKNLSFA
jgi:hypothetical protein